jgi:5'-methylthioadenosine phosphorylase
MEGPQFSSLAESELYRTWNCDVIGMTNTPEAKLAREAEMCYATVAMVTDYDCWHPNHDNVTVAAIRLHNDLPCPRISLDIKRAAIYIKS